MIAYDNRLYKILGSHLRKLRKNNGFSLEYVADHIGKTKKTIQRYETGEHRMNIATIKSLCEVYGYDYETLNQEVESELTKNQSYYGDYDKTVQHLNDKPDLLNLYNEIVGNESLTLLFDNAKDLSPEDMEVILKVINGLKRERSGDSNDF